MRRNGTAPAEADDDSLLLDEQSMQGQRLEPEHRGEPREKAVHRGHPGGELQRVGPGRQELPTRPAISRCALVGRGSGSGRAVIGRAWSCPFRPSPLDILGSAEVAWIAVPVRASWRSARSGSDGAAAAGAWTCSIPPPALARTITSRRPARRSAMLHPQRRLRSTMVGRDLAGDDCLA